MAMLRFLAVVLALAVVYGCEAQNKRPVSSTAWTTSGQVLYANEYAPNAGAVPAPYILGGTCVCPPDQAALSRYQAAGFLKNTSLSQLQEAYRAEGITWDAKACGGVPGLHPLEGGACLLTPLPGTTGYARLFGEEHPAYSPKSDLARQLAADVKAQIPAYLARPRTPPPVPGATAARGTAAPDTVVPPAAAPAPPAAAKPPAAKPYAPGPTGVPLVPANPPK